MAADQLVVGLPMALFFVAVYSQLTFHLITIDPGR